MERLRAGDEQAFEALVERYSGTMLAIAGSYVTTPAATHPRSLYATHRAAVPGDRCCSSGAGERVRAQAPAWCGR